MLHRRADLRPGRRVPQPQRVVSDHDRMRLSSRLNSAPRTEPSCFIAGPICAPVAASHSRSVPSSSDHDRMRRSSRLNTAPPNRAIMRHRRADLRPGRRVPQPQRPVVRPRQDAAFVPAEQRAAEPRPSCFIAGPICAPVAASHSRSVLSSDHDRMRLSSRLNSAPLTEPSCFIAGPICAPVAASHSRSVRQWTTTGCGFRPG